MATVLEVGVFNKVLAATTGSYINEFGMNVYNDTPLFRRLVERGKKTKWAGESRRVKVVGATYKTAQSYTDYDTGNTGQAQPFTRADFELGGYMQWVTFSGMEERKNKTAGAQQIFDLIKAETSLAVQSIRDAMSTNLYQATNDAKGILSLSTLTDATTTIAGIAGSSTWGGTTTTSGSFSAQGKTDMWTLFLTLGQYAAGLETSKGITTEPDLIIMNPTTSYRYYLSAMETAMRYEPQGKGDVGFGSVTYMGKEIVKDPFITTTQIIMLNLDQLELCVMPGADMTAMEDRQSYNADSWSMPILWNGQLCTRARRFHGKLTGVTS